MAEEFQTGICNGSRWSYPAKSAFMGVGSSPCLTGNNIVSDVGSYWSSSSSYWMTDIIDMKERTTSSCKEGDQFSMNNNSVSDDSSNIVFHNSQNHDQPVLQVDSSDSGCSGGSSSSLLIDSTLQMMGFGVSSSLSSSDWNHQEFVRGSGRADDQSYNFMLQDEMNSGLNSSQVQKDWNSKRFSSTGGEESSMTSFKAINQDFSLDQQGLNPLNTSTCNPTANCSGLSPTSYGYPSTVIQGLFEEPDPSQTPQLQSLLNHQSMSYSSTTTAAATPNYGTNLMNELSPSWIKPSFPKQQQQHPNAFHFSNNTPFWNTSAASMSDVGATFLTSSQPQLLVPTFEQKPNCPCPSLAKKTANNDEVRNLGSVVKKGSEPAIKRPRIETPSPLPTFKVRKEKLGDRITALQQLVSPFGKTDTASVLHEAIEYIKYLHDQVSALSTPYMKNSNAIQHQQGVDKMKEADAGKKDLSSRGLCLVPISSTFPVANESSPDFWMPTLGGHFQVGRMS